MPLSLDTLLRRQETAEALAAAGYPVTTSRLAAKNGAPYRVFGRVALYRWGDALEWAHGQMKPPRRAQQPESQAKAA